MLADMLAKRYGEVQRSMGLVQDNTVMELYANEKTGTWTLTVTVQEGMTCFVAAGTDFKTAKPGVPS